MENSAGKETSRAQCYTAVPHLLEQKGEHMLHFKLSLKHIPNYEIITSNLHDKERIIILTWDLQGTLRDRGAALLQPGSMLPPRCHSVSHFCL